MGLVQEPEPRNIGPGGNEWPWLPPLMWSNDNPDIMYVGTLLADLWKSTSGGN